MRIGELYAGIGGLGVAAHWAFGGSVAWQLDRVGERVRARHFPEAVQFAEDVTTVDPRRLEPVDVLCAGFACQDLSVAGAGASKADLDAGSRTGVTYRETLRFVGALRPRFVVLENVPPLVQHMRRLQRDLAGYGLTWTLCTASDVGAPHGRRRVFVLGERGAVGRGLVEVHPSRAWSPEGEARAWATITASEAGGRRPSVGRREDPDMLSEQVRLWGTPRVGGGTCREVEEDRGRIEDQVRLWPTPLARDYKVGGGGANMVGTEPLSESAAPVGAPGRRLNPDWVEALMGYPIGWTLTEGPRLTPERSPRYPRARYPEGWDRAQPWQGYPWEPSRTLPDGPPAPGRPARLMGLGNAVHPQQGAFALETMLRPQQVGLWEVA